MKKLLFSLSVLLLFSCKKDTQPPTVSASVTVGDKTQTFKALKTDLYRPDKSSVFALHNVQPLGERYEIYATDEKQNSIYLYVWTDKAGLPGVHDLGNYQVHVTIEPESFSEVKDGAALLNVTDGSNDNFTATFSGTYVLPNGDLKPFTGNFKGLKIYEYK